MTFYIRCNPRIPCYCHSQNTLSATNLISGDCNCLQICLLSLIPLVPPQLKSQTIPQQHKLGSLSLSLPLSPLLFSLLKSMKCLSSSLSERANTVPVGYWLARSTSLAHYTFVQLSLPSFPLQSPQLMRLSPDCSLCLCPFPPDRGMAPGTTPTPPSHLRVPAFQWSHFGSSS